MAWPIGVSSVIETCEIGPLQVEMESSQLRFRFAAPDAITLEIPMSLEEELSSYLAEHQEHIAGRRLVIDLQDLPAISSRQLGIMLTIRKVCQPIGTVELEAVSEGVRYLLNLTKMAQYFDLSEPASG